MEKTLIENEIDRGQLMRDYWEEYLHDYVLDENYWFSYNINQNTCKRLHSPFLNHDWFLSDEEMNLHNPKKNAIHRKNMFKKEIKSESIIDVRYAISLVEKNSRTIFLYEHFLKSGNADKFSDIDVWSVISYVWVSTEFNCGTTDGANGWREIFSHRSRPRELVQELPEKITLFRGGHRKGFSWTPDIEVAKSFQARTANWFARHVQSDDANQVELLTMTVGRDDILFKGERENELVLDPYSMDYYFRNNQFQVLGAMETKR